MKLYLVLLVVLVAVLSTIYGAPSKGSTKASLKKKATCTKECGETYKPVCASEGDRKISFGSECVLSNYNCENQKNLRVVSQGECPGGGGVRLS
ncbi:agrin-like [Sitophilus oryzae]|uniref:Agrin-like n=1 Tax=Sitophilus oryzae TaxID=7048 RepID=A0A6J2YRV3_SITOR|nr:agrin-like [Sitophilus oryzae]